MTALMRFLLNIWFRGYMDGYFAAREEELHGTVESLKKQCYRSPSGYVALRVTGKGRLEAADLPKGVIAFASDYRNEKEAT